MSSEYDRGTVCGLVLLPDPDATAHLITASAELCALGPSQVILGARRCLPHISVIHLRLAPGRHAAVWAAAAPMLKPQYAVEAMALYLKPHDGRVWSGVEIRKTAALTALHNDVLDRCEAMGIEVLSEPGDRYWPHITLARWQNPPHAALPPHDVISTHFTAAPVLAEMGPHGTVERILERGARSPTAP